MICKSQVHGLWQYVCHDANRVSCGRSAAPQVVLFQFPRNRDTLPLGIRSIISTHALSNLNSRSHSVVVIARPAHSPSSLHPVTLFRQFGSLPRVPRYISPLSKAIANGAKIPIPFHGDNVSTSVTNGEHRDNMMEDISVEPLLEDGVIRRNPVKVSQLYDQLKRHAVAGRIEDVWETIKTLVAEEREKPNLRLYNALVLVNIGRASGSAAAVATVLEEMEREGISADVNVYHAALKALAVHPDCVLRGVILSEMRRRWFTLNESGWHDVVAGYAREGLIEQALESLDAMRKSRIRIQGWLYDLILYTLCDMGEIDAATEMIKVRVMAGDNTISSGAWFYLFDHACAGLHYDTLKFIWLRRVESQYINPNSGQCLQVLTAAARHGDAQVATDVFRVLSKKATTFESQHYELLIETYIEADDLRTALTILCIMNGAGLTPTQSATSSILKYLKRAPERPRDAFSILSELKTNRQVPTEAMNRIIEACVQQNGLIQAIEMYSSLHTICPNGPNVATFNTLLIGCRNDYRKDTAMFLVGEMLAMKIRPNTITYDRLILVCLLEHDYEDAVRYYKEMRNTGLSPRLGTMVALIKRCCDAGDDRAWSLLEEMKSLGMDDTQSRQYMSEKFPNPSESFERAVSNAIYPSRAYRNPLVSLVSFLDSKHGSDWAIWEFRAEGTGYPDSQVYNRIWHFPWPDHHPPPFRLIPSIMASMRDWLHPVGEGSDEKKSKRVVVVHCKAGKGRSGTSVVSYLMSEEGWKREDALNRFTERRMRPGFGAGVSIPSQLRYVGYVERWINGGKMYVEQMVEVLEVHFWGLRDGVKITIESYVEDGRAIKTFHIFEKGERDDVDRDGKQRSKAMRSRSPSPSVESPEGTNTIFRPSTPILLPTNDINLAIERRTRGGYGLTMVTAVAHIWFNTFFEGNGPENYAESLKPTSSGTSAQGTPWAADSGVFESPWDSLDGIKGSSRKGTRAFDKCAVVWRVTSSSSPSVSAASGSRDRAESIVIMEPGPGEPVTNGSPAGWRGRKLDPDERIALQGPAQVGKNIGLQVQKRKQSGGSSTASTASRAPGASRVSHRDKVDLMRGGEAAEDEADSDEDGAGGIRRGVIEV